jgi:hypothetical protein
MSSCTLPAEWSDPNTAPATPKEGHRAPPPTPATLVAALQKNSGSLEPVPEDDDSQLLSGAKDITQQPIERHVAFDDAVLIHKNDSFETLESGDMALQEAGASKEQGTFQALSDASTTKVYRC